MTKDSDDETCPVCGQSYDYKREERGDGPTHVLRDDATECRVIEETGVGFGRDKTYDIYVHLMETNSVVRDPQDELDWEISGYNKSEFSGGPKDG